MKIVQQEKQKRKLYLAHIAKKIVHFLNKPLFLIPLFAILLAISFVSGAYLYKTGKITESIASYKDVKVETQEEIQRELSPYIDNGLSTLYIDIAFDDFQKISAKRDEALASRILMSSDQDYVPGTLHLDDDSLLDIKLRLKGDWVDHLKDDKWSFRIHIKGDDQVFGMRNFSIQSPETRELLNEWAFHQYLLQNGIMTTHMDFVNVIINGEPKGIFVLEESFAEELIESEKQRQGVLLRFSEEDMWQNNFTFWSNGFELDGGFWVTDLSTATVSLYRESTVLSDEVLSKEALTAVSLLQGYQRGDLSASEVFDIDLMGKFYAACDLWGGEHGTAWHNIRFYYNPVTTYLEPVLYDANALNPIEVLDTLAKSFSQDELFSDPGVRIAYAKYLQEFTNSEHLENYFEYLEEDFNLYHDALDKEYFRDAESELLVSPMNNLLERAKILQLQFETETPISGAIRPVWLDNNQRKGYFLEVSLQSEFIIPVDLYTVSINGIQYKLDQSMIDEETRNSFLYGNDTNLQIQPVKDWYILSPVVGKLYVPFKNDLYDPLTADSKIVVQIAGTRIQRTVKLTQLENVDIPLSDFRPEIQTLDKVLSLHPYLKLINEDKKEIEFSVGEWEITTDLILPKDYSLTIHEGTTLQFSDDAILYTTGALFFEGTEQNPVVLEALNDSWPGMVVIQAEDKSILQHTIVRDTTSIHRGGWILTGGITFYESPVKLDHVKIDGTFAEDSINVIRTTFEFIDSSFSDTASDAFDSDFSDGTIVGCSFENVGGDAVDISGSLTEVYNTTFDNIFDKAMSVGEHSSIFVQDVEINGAGLGIASKDLSNATLLRVNIKGAKNAALAAYQKKAVFGPASITGEEVSITDCERISIIQIGSEAIVNGSTLDTVNQTFDDLFNQGLLGS